MTGVVTQDRERPKPKFGSRLRESERKTRKPLAFWDRIKFLLLLAVLFAFFRLAEVTDNPLLPYSEAWNRTLRDQWWIVRLFVVALIRHIHYLSSEPSEGYHRFWSQKVFGGFKRRVQ